MENKIFIFVLGTVLGIILGYLLAQFTFQSIMDNKSKVSFAMGVQLQNKKSDEAIPYFYQSIAYDPNWYAPHLGLARIYEKKNDLVMALDEYCNAQILIHDNKVVPYDSQLIDSKVKELSQKLGEPKGRP